MKNELIPTRRLLEAVSYDPPTLAPTSAHRHYRMAESHPGELETMDTVANSPDSFDPILEAVQECRTQPFGDFQRIVVILAPPDRPRARLASTLAKQNRATVTTVATLRRRHPLEQLLRPWCSKGRPVVVIDQGESLDCEELYFLKLLINLTPVVIVLLATARAYQAWRQSWPVEARQIHRRTHMVFARCDP
jgi:hypothetical protein